MVYKHIDANAFARWLSDRNKYMHEKYDHDMCFFHYNELLKVVDEMPESVVRCKDCKHYINLPIGSNLCSKHSTTTHIVKTSEMDYCSKGERKEKTE